jgi:hypothetical protein
MNHVRNEKKKRGYSFNNIHNFFTSHTHEPCEE